MSKNLSAKYYQEKNKMLQKKCLFTVIRNICFKKSILNL